MKLVRGYECSKLLHFGLREFKVIEHSNSSELKNNTPATKESETFCSKLFTLLQNKLLLQFIGNMYNSEKTSDNSITWKDVDRIKIWEWSYHC
ncbi:Protein of unknown function [Cotesia congregata]|uniref:Uncharacterized protein n=1 Tax=Cotesia congregata TaxID=51543 RepID=A0A8J2E087_COTCN|nr:Protein of unknown function [Cotesia congregata]